jgi:hypothetical protein
MTFDNKLQLFRPTMIRFLYSSILCEKASAFTECCPGCRLCPAKYVQALHMAFLFDIMGKASRIVSAGLSK